MVETLNTVGLHGIAEPVPDAEHCAEHQQDYITYDDFADDPAQNSTHYDRYARQYDSMHDKAGFNDPYWLTRVAVEKLGVSGGPLSNPDARIIDFGCGTGRVGAELQKVGFTNISGIDGSAEMLSVTMSKGFYKWTG